MEYKNMEYKIYLKYVFVVLIAYHYQYYKSVFYRISE